MGNHKYYAVMLIDDNEIDNLINQKMIESISLSEKIYLHSGARSAIEFLKSLEGLIGDTGIKILPELIFLDIDMPLMDGFQFLDQFQTLNKKIVNHCKVIMLTSSTNPRDTNKAKKYGSIHQYINKPLTQKTLKEINI